MTAFAAVCLSLFAGWARAQPSTETVVQAVQPDGTLQIFLMAQPVPGKPTPRYYLKTQTWADGKMINYSLRSVLDTASLCSGWPVEQGRLHIFFVNPRLGFLYGRTVGYGHCAFLFRTADGGHSWSRVHVDPTRRQGPVSRQALFMFNEQRGVALGFIGQGLLHYYLTADGGQSWQEKTLPVAGKDTNSASVDSLLQALYATDGNVVLVAKHPTPLDRPPGRAAQPFTSYLSTDFGQTFRTLK